MERRLLKDGNWIDIRSKEEVTVRGRRSLQTISMGMKDFLMRTDLNSDTNITDLDMSEEEFDSMLRLQEATLVALVAAWSFPEPITLESVANIPTPRFDEISEIIAPLGAELAAAQLDTRATLEPDPKDHSGNSGASDGLLKDVSALT